jgi:hypothetical protein
MAIGMSGVVPCARVVRPVIGFDGPVIGFDGLVIGVDGPGVDGEWPRAGVVGPCDEVKLSVACCAIVVRID